MNGCNAARQERPCGPLKGRHTGLPLHLCKAGSRFILTLHKSFVLDGTVCPSLRGLTVDYSGITH